MRIQTSLLVGFALFIGSRAGWASGPASVSFQGFLRDKAGQPVTSPAAGTPVTFSLYAAPADSTPVWSETDGVQAAAGRFTALLGSTVPFPPGVAFDKPYWIGIKVGSDPEMTPRLPLQAVPYALNAWSVGGNAGTDPTKQFLGTTDAVPLVLKLNGHQGLRLEEVLNAGGGRSINILGGVDANTMSAGAVGSVIAGGGIVNSDGTSSPNEMSGNLSVIGGGAGNFVDADYYMVIGGGSGNVAQGTYSTIGGGNSNNTQGQWSTIGGGSGNYASAAMATVAGGTNNQATGAYSAIAGGSGNMALDQYAAVAGGSGNQALGTQSFVGAGLKNVGGALAAVGAGQENKANGLRSFIGSGNGNTTGPGYDAVIGGGQNNVASGGDSGVLGGYQNTASGNDSAALGGKFNSASGEGATVGGGTSNTVSGLNAAIGGGNSNNATGQSNVIAGGENNISKDLWSVVGGGSHNWAVAKGAFAGGGYANSAQGIYSMVPGGAYNTANDAAFAAGYRAKALNTGSFVWSDFSADQDFASELDNQFCIRAKGGLVLESFGSPGLYTGQGTTDMHRYLLLLNSTKAPAASGLKAGGILCADSFDYANPGKSNLVVKGTVGVGYPDPAPYQLAVNGKVYAVNGYSPSDARYKTDIHTLDQALQMVLRLRGVSFEWDQARWKGREFPDGRQVGLIAQEVEKVLPEAVVTDPSGYKAVSYQSFIPLLVESVKALKERNDDLAARNKALESKLEDLTRAVAALQAGRR